MQEAERNRASPALLGISLASGTKWSQRFERQRLEGLQDKRGRGRRPTIPVEKVERVITEAGQAPRGRQRWCTRTLLATGVSICPASVQRIWPSHDLRSQPKRAFTRSSGAQFEETFWGVMGLYLRPSDKALVLCRDEKSRCQALARIPPGLPLGIGPNRTPGHDYVRHGTITLFAALNYLKGRIIGRTEAKHAHVEWRRVLKRIGREVSKDLAVHLFVDNDCTHKHAEVNAWLAKHRRFHGHFTPVGSAWLNLVERFFADLTQDVVRNGSFGSVRQLLSRIELYLAERKENPKPYQWKANRNEVLAGIHRARLAAGQ